MSRPTPSRGDHGHVHATTAAGASDPTVTQRRDGPGPASTGDPTGPGDRLVASETPRVSGSQAQPHEGDAPGRKTSGGQTGREEEASSKRYVKYTFFKVAREWRFLDQVAREKAKAEFLEALHDDASSSSGVRLGFFSLVGLRGDTDFMIAAESASVEPFQSVVSKLLFSTQLGRYLDIPYSYLAMTRRSRYLGAHKHPGQEGTTTTGEGTNADGVQAGAGSRYLFVYPFTKKREWYRLAFTERQRVMAEHFKVGHKYPRIKINTGYSFGLDDQEFMLAFEGDDPSEFLALVEELRSSEASAYTQVETPIFTCLRVGSERMLELLG